MLVFYLLLHLMMVASNALDPPIVQPFQFPSDLRAGQSTKVLCTVVSGTRPLTFRWRKDGGLLPTDRWVRVETLPDFSVLVIEPLSVNHSGNYSCRAENGAGASQQSATLAVSAPPQWVVEPTDLQAAWNSRVELRCEASGFPLPKISWTRLQGGVEETGGTKVEGGWLIFPKIRRGDSGKYSCTADNGEQIRKTITLLVSVPARIEGRAGAMVTAKRGESARLKCNATGDQPLAVTWKRRSEPMAKSGPNHEVFETLTAEGLESELVVRETGRADGGPYICRAENGFGHDERTFRLAVQEVPGPSADVKVADTWSRAAYVTWSPPPNGNSPITKYIVQFYLDHAGSAHHEQDLSSLQSSTLLTDLHPGSLYHLSVTAENAIGRGSPSRSVRFRTNTEEPSKAPGDVSAEAKGPTTVKVSWRPPPAEQWNGALQGYYVGYRLAEAGAPEDYTFRQAPHGGPDQLHQFLLNQLTAGREYTIVVAAFNNAGSGPQSSPPAFVKTLDGDLPESPHIYVLSTSATGIKIGWSIPRSAKVPVTGFRVHHRKENSPWQEGTTVPSSETSHTFSSLEPGVSYQVYVTAASKLGPSDPSDIVTVRTDTDYGTAPLSSGNMKDGLPAAYLHLTILVPVAACLVAVVVVAAVACVCVRRLRLDSLERGLPEDDKIYGGSIALAPIPLPAQSAVASTAGPSGPVDPTTGDSIYPAPYATLPMRDDRKEGLHQEMKMFFEKQQQKERPPAWSPQPTSSSADEQGSNAEAVEDENIYDIAQ